MRFDVSEINSKLTTYKQNKKHFQILLLNHSELQKHIIEGYCMKAMNFNDKNPCSTNKIVSITEQAVLNLNLLETKEDKALIKLATQIISCEIEFKRFNDKYQFILEKYIDRLDDTSITWEDMAELFFRKFDRYITDRTIKNWLFKRILPKLNKVLIFID